MGGEVNTIDSMSASVRPFTSTVSLVSLAVWCIASSNKVCHHLCPEITLEQTKFAIFLVSYLDRQL